MKRLTLFLFVPAMLFISCSKSDQVIINRTSNNGLLHTYWVRTYPDPKDLFSGNSSLSETLKFISADRVEHNFLDSSKKLVSTEELKYINEEQLTIYFDGSPWKCTLSNNVISRKYSLGTDIFYKQ